MRAGLTDKAKTEDDPIPGAGFDSSKVVPPERFEAWRESMTPAHDIRPLRDGRCDPRVMSSGWTLDTLLLSDLAFSPIAYRRRPGRAGEYLLLRSYQEGQARGIFEDSAFRTRPGEIHLFDQMPECRGVTTDWHRLRSVFIPYSAVQYEPGRHPAHVRVDADTAVGRLLNSAIETLFAELPRTRQADAAVLAAGFAGLVKGLLLAGAPSAGASRDFGATRLVAMRRYLDEHLRDPELGVARLCAAFGVSRATVYRDFAKEGGVERFVVRRRLERAFCDLAGGPAERGRVRRVAERWGFVCPYHFSRAFRKQFDRWPSEVCGIGAPAPRAPTDVVAAPGALPEVRAGAGA